ncbi:hypothetical protein GOP47_0011916, partial [Adiantum capillus-veneris]
GHSHSVKIEFIWATFLFLNCPCSFNVQGVRGMEMGEAKMDTIVFFIHIDVERNYVQLASGGEGVEDIEGILVRLFGYATPITEGPSRQSHSLGFVRGLSLILSPSSDSPSSSVAPTKEHLLNTIEYDDGVVKGTIAQHGFIEFPPPYTEESELAVVGGTGDFHLVQGYSKPTLVSLDPIVICLNVHLLYPRAPLSSSTIELVYHIHKNNTIFQ